jgi:hypothetical protein
MSFNVKNSGKSKKKQKRMINTLVQIGHTILVLIGATFFVWSAYLIDNSDTYLILSPIHIVIMTFYFNMFLIRFNFPSYPKVTRCLNMLVNILTGVMFVYGDVVYYHNSKQHEQHQHAPATYISYIVIDSLNVMVLLLFNYNDYKSGFLKSHKDILFLLGWQFIYILNLLSQVVPLYSRHKIALTNDFVFMFWMIFILEEVWRDLRKKKEKRILDDIERNSIRYHYNSLNDISTSSLSSISITHTSPFKYYVGHILLLLFYIVSTASIYFYVTINMLDNNNTILFMYWDICLLTANSLFYLWTFTTFEKVD